MAPGGELASVRRASVMNSGLAEEASVELAPCSPVHQDMQKMKEEKARDKEEGQTEDELLSLGQGPGDSPEKTSSCSRGGGKFRKMFFDFGLDALLQSVLESAEDNSVPCASQPSERPKTSCSPGALGADDQAGLEYSDKEEKDVFVPSQSSFSSFSSSSTTALEASQSLRVLQRQLPRLLANMRASDEEVERVAVRLRELAGFNGGGEARAKTLEGGCADVAAGGMENLCCRARMDESEGGAGKGELRAGDEEEESHSGDPARPRKKIRVSPGCALGFICDTNYDQEREDPRVEGTVVSSGEEELSQINFDVSSQLLCSESQPLTASQQTEGTQEKEDTSVER